MLKIRHWTKAETELLCVGTIEEPVLLTDEELSELIDRTASSIRQRRQRLLRPSVVRAAKARQLIKHNGNRHPNQSQWHIEYYERGTEYAIASSAPWTPEEEDRIMSADRPKDHQLARELGRTVKSVHAHRYFLRREGIVCHPRRREGLTPEVLAKVA